MCCDFISKWADGKACVKCCEWSCGGHREIWDSQTCYSSPAKGLSYREVPFIYPFPYLTKFFTLLWRFYLLFTVIAKGPLKWQEVRETAVEVVKKKSKEGFIQNMRESEKSLVLHKPLSVCSNVHLPCNKACLLIQGLYMKSELWV